MTVFADKLADWFLCVASLDGHMPPFLLRDGSPEEITDRILEDFRKSGQSGDGDVQEYCRYECLK